ncbi:hypothetical protein [Vibrio aphrogenes]|uniref:hypothetical protein n=1 Tax=Vibrio aphrogenes TaxID=1891186 RepID=UPI000B363CF0|nr:hypothetical protein [Vibrio aphrogenes]
MTVNDRIEDLEQQIYIAYAEGDYQQATQLEKKLKSIRGQSMQHQEHLSEPYSLEGHVFIDDD